LPEIYSSVFKKDNIPQNTDNCGQIISITERWEEEMLVIRSGFNL
jgi:hypothetical protein